MDVIRFDYFQKISLLIFYDCLFHPLPQAKITLAEGRGFEPLRAVRPYWFSRPAPSSARPSLRGLSYTRQASRANDCYPVIING